MTANTSQEKKKEVAKEKRVQDHGRSIIEVKKSFRYLDLKRQQSWISSKGQGSGLHFFLFYIENNKLYFIKVKSGQVALTRIYNILESD